MCQQQSRLNYKSRVYTAHTGGAPGVARYNEWGSCVIEPYRTPTKWTTTPSLGDIAALANKLKHREAAKMRRQRNMAQMKEQNKTLEKKLKKKKERKAIY